MPPKIHKMKLLRIAVLSCLTIHRTVGFNFCKPLASIRDGSNKHKHHATTPGQRINHGGIILRARRPRDEDSIDHESYYIPSSPRSSISKQQRAVRARRSPENQYYDEYFEDDFEEEFPIQEPILSNGEKLASYKGPWGFEFDDEDVDGGDGNDDEPFDDDDYYEYIDEEEVEEDEDDDDTPGNFWSNPAGGVDRVAKRPSYGRTPPPRAEEEYAPRPRRRRAPFRSSSTSTAPPAAKDFYERLFWYGFDAGNSEGVGDRTAFGGTKGKFNGLSFFQASEPPNRSLKPRKDSARQLPPSRRNLRDDYHDEEEDVYDEEFESEAGEYTDRDTLGSRDRLSLMREYTPPEDLPSTRQERMERKRRKGSFSEFDEKVSPEAASSRPRRRQRRPRNYVDKDDYSKDFVSEGVSRQVSSWFTDDDEEENYESRPMDRRGRRRTQSKGTTWSPFNVLDAFFGVNREELSYKAEEYNSKMGIGARTRSPRNQRRQPRDVPRRLGYAYRYNADDGIDDDREAPSVVDVEPLVLEDVPLEANGSGPTTNAEDVSTSSDRRGKELSWEERALAVERVPPADIPGWGPSGELPIDGRTKAIMDALEDIQTARQKLEAREKKEALAKEDITILKVDAEMQRRQLEDSRSSARAARERLREIELDIDDASRVLRRARTQVQLARDQLDELQARHWAVLGTYNPDQAEERVAEALNEYRLSASVDRPLSNGAIPTHSATLNNKEIADSFPYSDENGTFENEASTS